MIKKKHNIPFVLLLTVLLVAIAAACGGNQGQEPAVGQSAAQTAQSEAEHEEAEAEHQEGEKHEEGEAHTEGEAEHEDDHGPEEHLAGGHDVPDDAAAVDNPVSATEASIVAGATIYAQNCAVCHGETGEGDGPAAPSLAAKPSDLHEEHVQENSDGALFWIISHGRPESPMPPWDNVLAETERWHVVNFLRTLGDSGE